jgi:hypothetical protein
MVQEIGLPADFKLLGKESPDKEGIMPWMKCRRHGGLCREGGEGS